MKKKFNYSIGVLVVVTVVVGAFWHVRKDANLAKTVTVNNSVYTNKSIHKIGTVNTNLSGKEKSLTKVNHPQNPTRLFPEIEPLTKSEQEKFKVVPDQIVRFYDWGQMDDEQVDAFRQQLWELGERGIASVANELNAITVNGTKIDKDDAKRSISHLDMLRYLAQQRFPLAVEAVEQLAQREVKWDESGRLQDPPHAAVTFESFQIYSANNPRQAEDFIKDISSEDHKTAYIYHYIVGQKLANVQQETAVAQAKLSFGDTLVEKALN